MCEFCVKHGEGKKWYLNARNYSSELLSDMRRKAIVKDFFYWTDRNYKRYFNILKWLPEKIPIVGLPVKNIVKRMFINEHWGQVIPVEDVEKILAMTNSIVRIPCVCRNITTGRERRTCFLVSMDPGGLGMADIVDQSFFGGPDVAKFEKFDKTNALDFVKEQETNGLFHSIWTVGTPFATGLCNCDNSGCIAMKMLGIRAPIFFKAEYTAIIDKDACAGCKACVKICPFAAITYDGADKKAEIDRERCYGCGICRVSCKKDAIRLQEKQNV